MHSNDPLNTMRYNIKRTETITIARTEVTRQPEVGTMYMYDGLDSPSISIFHLNHQSAIHLKTVIIADDIWMQT